MRPLALSRTNPGAEPHEQVALKPSNTHVRFYVQDSATKGCTRFEPCMTTTVDPDTGQILSVVDGRDNTGVRDWPFDRPLAWSLAVQVVAIDPSSAFSNALRMSRSSLPSGLSGQPSNDRGPAEPLPAGQGAPRPGRGQGRGASDAPAARRDTLTERAAHRLEDVFAADDPIGSRRRNSVSWSKQPCGQRRTCPTALSAGGERNRGVDVPVLRRARSRRTIPL
jgi:hypothetical protein